ncbi:MAG: NTP transferase domain-containing protein [Candidatus Omnitrophica bacterium]|nr:NTP transferase domain-containing protein [Candidatus Omnitrophota bacterium]
MKTTAIIQARMGARRLPGKVLMELSGRPVLEHVINRVMKARNVSRIIVATSLDREDKKIADFAKSRGVNVYRGSQDDVLDRFYRAALCYSAEHIIRITADCPVLDPGVIDRVADMYFGKEADYCSNVMVPTFPDGEDVEIFSFKSLKEAWERAELPSEREHVTPYIRNHPERFKCASLENDQDLSHKRWTLDRIEDYRFLEVLFGNLYKENPFFGMGEILGFLRGNPEAGDINSNIARNEGYARSLEEDEKVIKDQQRAGGGLA